MRPAGCCPPGDEVTGWWASLAREHLFWFFLVGAVSSLVDIGLLWYFCQYWGIWYIPAAAVSYCCGILVSYVLNKYLTFRDPARDYFLQFTTFAVISVSCLMVNLCIIWLAVELASLNYLVAKVIATVCAFFWNYYGQSRITFRGR
jgi:putative flippase GtrA